MHLMQGVWEGVPEPLQHLGQVVVLARRHRGLFLPAQHCHTRGPPTEQLPCQLGHSKRVPPVRHASAQVVGMELRLWQRPIGRIGLPATQRQRRLRLRQLGSHLRHLSAGHSAVSGWWGARLGGEEGHRGLQLLDLGLQLQRLGLELVSLSARHLDRLRRLRAHALQLALRHLLGLLSVPESVLQMVGGALPVLGAVSQPVHVSLQLGALAQAPRARRLQLLLELRAFVHEQRLLLGRVLAQRGLRLHHLRLVLVALRFEALHFLLRLRQLGPEAVNDLARLLLLLLHVRHLLLGARHLRAQRERLPPLGAPLFELRLEVLVLQLQLLVGHFLGLERLLHGSMLPSHHHHLVTRLVSGGQQLATLVALKRGQELTILVVETQELHAFPVAVVVVHKLQSRHLCVVHHEAHCHQSKNCQLQAVLDQGRPEANFLLLSTRV
mmetsp:Transcript_16255/g.31227  ORF Transcript_16255/g.31227 Transcript_16255/m.31227 type:complete len:439 (+) Transcript_16255:831-2147(+)